MICMGQVEAQGGLTAIEQNEMQIGSGFMIWFDCV